MSARRLGRMTPVWCDCRRERGLTLAELLVALTVSLAVVLGAGRLLGLAGEAYAAQTEAAAIDDGGSGGTRGVLGARPSSTGAVQCQERQHTGAPSRRPSAAANGVRARTWRRRRLGPAAVMPAGDGRGGAGAKGRRRLASRAGRGAAPWGRRRRAQAATAAPSRGAAALGQRPNGGAWRSPPAALGARDGSTSRRWQRRSMARRRSTPAAGHKDRRRRRADGGVGQPNGDDD